MARDEAVAVELVRCLVTAGWSSGPDLLLGTGDVLAVDEAFTEEGTLRAELIFVF